MDKIGKIRLKNKLVLAPMAGVNCTAFRLLCKEYGAGLVYTQMHDASRICLMDQTEIKELLNIAKKERPVSVQLIGAQAESIQEAAKRVEKYADIIDLNFGCIVSEWLAKKTGSYFIKQKERLKDIVERVKSVIRCPLTVKTRLGWDGVDLGLAGLIESAGADAIAIHARTRKQRYLGNARAGWHDLKKISQTLSIPLIGNGDISRPSHVKGLLDYSGCELAMIGRAAMDNPYIFEQSLDYLNTGSFRREVRPIEMYDRFVELYREYESRDSLDEIRDHAIWFVKNTADSRKARNLLLLAKDAKTIRQIILKHGKPYNI